VKPLQACQTALLVLIVSLASSCNKATGLPTDDSASVGTSQTVPFDHQPQPAGTATARSTLVPVGKLREGTPITIRLLNTLSSASARTGDTFEGTLDDPIVIEGQTVIRRGSAVTGRVLAAKDSGQRHNRGYLRLGLVSLNVDGKPMAIETASLFVKAGHHDRTSDVPKSAVTPETIEKKEVLFEVERRLTFRLAQPLEFR
jgi:hypothetical protein